MALVSIPHKVNQMRLFKILSRSKGERSRAGLRGPASHIEPEARVSLYHAVADEVETMQIQNNFDTLSRSKPCRRIWPVVQNFW